MSLDKTLPLVKRLFVLIICFVRKAFTLHTVKLVVAFLYFFFVRKKKLHVFKFDPFDCFQPSCQRFPSRVRVQRFELLYHVIAYAISC